MSPDQTGTRADAQPGVTVCAVVVSFGPDVPGLTATLESLVRQVERVVVVDNGTAPDVLADVVRVAGRLGVHVLAHRRNLGLATAQNAGIAWARQQDASHVLLLDQDSLPAPDMVRALLRAWRDLAAHGRVAAVGPRYRDVRGAEPAPFVRVAFPVSTKLQCGDGRRTVACDFLISSGLLIPLAVLDDVGAMEDALFIDNVDLEWSFRARSRGWHLHGVCDATMTHRLGEHVSVLGGRRTIVAHSPSRLYFIMRNRLALYRRPHTPRVWIAQDMPRVLIKFAIFAVLVGPRRSNIRFMARGLFDGLRGRLGPCPLVDR